MREGVPTLRYRFGGDDAPLSSPVYGGGGSEADGRGVSVADLPQHPLHPAAQGPPPPHAGEESNPPTSRCHPGRRSRSGTLWRTCAMRSPLCADAPAGMTSFRIGILSGSALVPNLVNQTAPSIVMATAGWSSAQLCCVAVRSVFKENRHLTTQMSRSNSMDRFGETEVAPKRFQVEKPTPPQCHPGRRQPIRDLVPPFRMEVPALRYRFGGGDIVFGRSLIWKPF